MRELSLFTGAGGGLLGTKLLGWTPIGYVENDEYCQKVIAQRIRDGFLPEAPLFGDIRAFIGEGYARAYQGMVDVVSAGFPCQPFSVAGQRKGERDDRNLWPETIETIRQVRPRFCFLENVPGLISCGYLAVILGDLAESGYDARWRVLSAGEVGAPHKRDRLWIVAYDSCARTWLEEHRGCGQGWKPADALEPEILRQGNGPSCAERANTSSADVADATVGMSGKQESGDGRKSAGGRSEEVADAEAPDWWRTDPADDPWRWYQEIGGQGIGGSGEEHGRFESEMGRVAHGVADRVGQLRALGNGQVPAVVASVWRLLMEEAGES